MKRVKQHQIDISNVVYRQVDQLCFASKNLYNTSQYNLRQNFIYGHRVLSQANLEQLIKNCSQTRQLYYALPTKVAQLVIQQATDAWDSYFKALSAYKEGKSKFTVSPRMPGYLPKNGRNLVKFNNQAVGKRELDLGWVVPSMSNIRLPTVGVNRNNLCEVRIVPKTGCYVIEVVYEEIEKPRETGTPQRVASADLGLDVLLCLTFNQPDIQPIAYNGKPLKAVNQWWNKEIARLRPLLPESQLTSKRLQSITRSRNNRVDYYMHCISSQLVEDLQVNKIDTLVIGKNPDWKRNINIGTRNNQNFVQIPYNKLVERIAYKCLQAGIQVIIEEESYTSKASFLDWDIIPTYGKTTEQPYFSGKRIERAWFKTNDGICIHADNNGSLNIGRKVIPSAYESINSIVRDRGCRAFREYLKVVVHPRRVTPVPMPNRGSAGKRVYTSPLKPKVVS